MNYGLHWFRRDLRISGNPALQWSWKEHSGRVLGLFCFDRNFLSRGDFSHNRFGFFLKTLRVLREELQALGGDLLVIDAPPLEAFARIHAAIQAQSGKLPTTVSYNRDYEPFARERDAQVTELLVKTYGIEVHSERDHLLFEPHELSKPDSADYYRVYTPFAKRWFGLLGESFAKDRIAIQRRALERPALDQAIFKLTWRNVFPEGDEPHDALEDFIKLNAEKVTVPLPEAGSLAARRALEAFGAQCIDRYGEQRDVPSIPGTSQMSLYLKNGSITVPQIIAALSLDGLSFTETGGRLKYLKELIWREFYFHILFHCPRVEHGAFIQKYSDIAWENRIEWFGAWKSGATGYPIVDAAMRQLKETGWMHNRARMIVASFLTKDLLIDWRWGERYFMEHLLDGDLAPNNGGWQWASSTGCDPQPYFRIFNPVLQGQKFDPDGEYIRRFVPELRTTPNELIHEPWKAGRSNGYPAPIVIHAEQKERALRLYEGPAQVTNQE